MISQRQYSEFLVDLAGEEPDVLLYTQERPLWSEQIGYFPRGGTLAPVPSLDGAPLAGRTFLELSSGGILCADTDRLTYLSLDSIQYSHAQSLSFNALPVLTEWEDSVFLASPLDSLRSYHQGSLGTQSGPVAVSLTVWRNHLFLAEGRQIRWSSFGDPWTWIPARENSADYVELNEKVVALHNVGDELAALSPNQLIVLNYVGLPRGIYWRPAQDGAGCSQPGTSIVFGGALYWYDHIRRTFWRWAGELTDIGLPIRSRLTDVPPHSCWSDPWLRHVFWSRGNSVLALDVVTNTWYQIVYDDLSIWYLRHFTPNPVRSVGGTVQAPDKPPALTTEYTERGGPILLGSSANARLVAGGTWSPQRRLRTKWLALNHNEALKELDLIHIRASGSGDVSVEVTNNLYATPQMVELGSWSGETSLTSSRVVGRYFRFIFTGTTPGRFDGFIVGYHERGARH